MATGTIKKPSMKHCVMPYISTQTITSGINVTYTATRDCLALCNCHIVASSDGVTQIYINDTAIMATHSNGACNYWNTVTLPLRSGDTVKVNLSTGASDSSLNIIAVE